MRRLTRHPGRVRIHELGDLARQPGGEAIERLRLHRAKPGQLPLGKLARGGDAAFAQIGRRSRTFEEMLARRPEEIIRLAVKGMMPRNRLARKQITKLKIYAGPEHPHVAQKPQTLEIEA